MCRIDIRHLIQSFETRRLGLVNRFRSKPLRLEAEEHDFVYMARAALTIAID